jgi:hypothetical protein
VDAKKEQDAAEQRGNHAGSVGAQDHPLGGVASDAWQKTGENAAKVQLCDSAQGHHCGDQGGVEADLSDRIQPRSKHPVG